MDGNFQKVLTEVQITSFFQKYWLHFFYPCVKVLLSTGRKNSKKCVVRYFIQQRIQERCEDVKNALTYQCSLQ